MSASGVPPRTLQEFLELLKWDDSAARRRRADIPEEAVYRPKWEIGLEQIRRALSNWREILKHSLILRKQSWVT